MGRGCRNTDKEKAPSGHEREEGRKMGAKDGGEAPGRFLEKKTRKVCLANPVRANLGRLELDHYVGGG